MTFALIMLGTIIYLLIGLLTPLLSHTFFGPQDEDELVLTALGWPLILPLMVGIGLLKVLSQILKSVIRVQDKYLPKLFRNPFKKEQIQPSGILVGMVKTALIRHFKCINEHGAFRKGNLYVHGTNVEIDGRLYTYFSPNQQGEIGKAYKEALELKRSFDENKKRAEKEQAAITALEKII